MSRALLIFFLFCFAPRRARGNPCPHLFLNFSCTGSNPVALKRVFEKGFCQLNNDNHKSQAVCSAVYTCYKSRSSVHSSTAAKHVCIRRLVRLRIPNLWYHGGTAAVIPISKTMCATIKLLDVTAHHTALRTALRRDSSCAPEFPNVIVTRLR